jgi:hypothetical protein
MRKMEFRGEQGGVPKLEFGNEGRCGVMLHPR